MAKSGGLQINQDLVFQRREWKMQHVGWWCLTGFVVLAAVGLFGGGPLSHARVGDPSSLSVEYERFTRVGAHTRLVVHGVSSGGRGPVDLVFDRDYFEGFRIERITPEPRTVDIGDQTVTLRFDRDAARSGGYTVLFDVEPKRGGRRRATIAVANGTTLTWRQFAYF